MRRAWFKFYGQDFLTDPKMLVLTSSQKMMWITLLCLVSTSEEEGIIKNIDEHRLKILSGIQFYDPITDEWKQTDGTLKQFEKLNMIQVKGETIEILNFKKRQSPQDSNDPDSVRERVQKYRNKSKTLPVTECNDRGEESRGDKKRIDKKREEILYTPNFEKFWNSYPLKVGKGKAFESWQKCKKPVPPLKELLLVVEKYKKTSQWKESDGKYIPHPTTWINQRRWEDNPKEGETENKSGEFKCKGCGQWIPKGKTCGNCPGF